MSVDATNLPNNDGKEISKRDDVEKALDLTDLTDQNWLFIKHYLETNDVKTSYQLAKYESQDSAAPYHIFKKLKPYIEELLSLGKVSRLSLINDLNKALSIPLVDKDKLTVSEWLRLRKFAGSLIPELKEDRKISVLVINRHTEGKGNNEQGKGNNPPLNIPPNDVIDIEPIG